MLIHPHFWRQRRLSIPGRDPQEIPTTSRRALVDAGFEVIEEQQPSFLFNRSVLLTGEVPRTTGYEAGFPLQEAWLDGRWQPDALVLDDQALIVDIKDKGLFVITGCGHAGIVNICRYARRLTKERALYAIIGGFHLNGPIFEPLIPRVLDDLGAQPPASWSRPTAPDGGPSTLWVLALARRSSRTPSVPASNSDRAPPHGDPYDETGRKLTALAHHPAGSRCGTATLSSTRAGTSSAPAKAGPRTCTK